MDDDLSQRLARVEDKLDRIMALLDRYEPLLAEADRKIRRRNRVVGTPSLPAVHIRSTVVP